jgi:hypothetical protein
MPKYERFEDLPAWQEAAHLYNHVLDLFESSNVKLSPGFRNQLDRAAPPFQTTFLKGLNGSRQTNCFRSST